ncbi:helix-turn-helix transcriptional regulator [Shewanella surugensis]|uniref:Helix-turn-helix domain containing protein n=1 Tax=Shewanella surugensis TaxID=212020 RepID=A0ABT0LIJ5_9GAMM|nr:helix-turn-helix transcriptional regulator [Shewanella surugensis]MCL1127511.1 helix-turn-helix domain containing protein [Shewanella surugensis]
MVTTSDGESINQMMDFVKNKKPDPYKYDGGSAILDRLLVVYGVETRPQLASCIGVSTGTMSTWQTRKSTPYEMLIRVSLATNARLEFLCFGEKPVFNDEPVIIEKTPLVEFKTLESGYLSEPSTIRIDEEILTTYQLKKESCLAIKSGTKTHFIDIDETEVFKGVFLFNVNKHYQIGEFKTLPDGKIYLIEDGDKYPVDLNETTIKGKVVATLDTSK